MTRRKGNGLPTGVTADEFYFCLTQNKCIWTAKGQMVDCGAVDKCLTIPKTRASAWLAKNRMVNDVIWAPGYDEVIEDLLMVDGGWKPVPGVKIYNTYRPSTLDADGDPTAAKPWVDHLWRIYPHDAVHITHWLAARVQQPHEKINHALVLGGVPGIGKDTILEPIKHCVGHWNFKEVSPKEMLGDFNPHVQCVILRCSEARDLGDISRYEFYEHNKTLCAGPPYSLPVNEKNVKKYYIPNVLGLIFTTNYKDGLYLPPDDRRHYVAWSDAQQEEFSKEYWDALWAWFDEPDTFANINAYLCSIDLADFNPKATPPKTQAFRVMVEAGLAPEDAEVADILDALHNPQVVTLAQLIANSGGGIQDWLKDRRNRRTVPRRLERNGYVVIPNPYRDGQNLWVVGGVRQIIYGRKDISEYERLKAAETLARSYGTQNTEGTDFLL